jgi:hypothetical protein
MLRRSRRAGAGEGGPSISSRPMRMRASGERSSCEALASSDLWLRTRVSTRSAASLKRRARKATSSLPVASTRTPRSPSPQRSTPPRRSPAAWSGGGRWDSCRRRRPRPRCPAARGSRWCRAAANGRAPGGPSPGRRWRGGSCTVSVWPSFIGDVELEALAGHWRGRTVPCPSTWPDASRTMISRAAAASARCAPARDTPATAAEGDGEQAHRGDHGEPDAQVQGEAPARRQSSPVQSCCLANT